MIASTGFNCTHVNGWNRGIANDRAEVDKKIKVWYKTRESEGKSGFYKQIRYKHSRQNQPKATTLLK